MNYRKRSRSTANALSAALITGVLLISVLQTACSGCRDFGKLACEPHFGPLFPARGR
jgi:hypothetical protein